MCVTPFAGDVLREDVAEALKVVAGPTADNKRELSLDDFSKVMKVVDSRVEERSSFSATAATALEEEDTFVQHSPMVSRMPSSSSLAAPSPTPSPSSSPSPSPLFSAPLSPSPSFVPSVKSPEVVTIAQVLGNL